VTVNCCLEINEQAVDRLLDILLGNELRVLGGSL
jgi:hypothetical protein